MPDNNSYIRKWRQKTKETIHIQPNIMSILRGGSDLHIPMRCRNDNTILIEPGRHGIRIKNRTNTFDVSYNFFGKCLNIVH